MAQYRRPVIATLAGLVLLLLGAVYFLAIGAVFFLAMASWIRSFPGGVDNPHNVLPVEFWWRGLYALTALLFRLAIATGQVWAGSQLLRVEKSGRVLAVVVVCLDLFVVVAMTLLGLWNPFFDVRQAFVAGAGRMAIDHVFTPFLVFRAVYIGVNVLLLFLLTRKHVVGAYAYRFNVRPDPFPELGDVGSVEKTGAEPTEPAGESNPFANLDSFSTVSRS